MCFFATALVCEGIEGGTSHSLLTWPTAKLSPERWQPFQTYSEGYRKNNSYMGLIQVCLVFQNQADSGHADPQLLDEGGCRSLLVRERVGSRLLMKPNFDPEAPFYFLDKRNLFQEQICQLC